MLPIIITVVIIGGLFLSWFLFPSVQNLSKEAWDVLLSGNREQLRSWVSQFGAAGVVILLFFFLVQIFAFVLPSWLLVVVSILAYGPIIGGIVALTGSVLAASVAYWIGRIFGEFTIKKIIGQKSEKKMKPYLQRYGFWVVAIFKLAPFLSNDIISYTAGLVSMSFPRFFLASVVGTSPLVVLIAFLGETNERLWNGFFIVSVFSIIGFIIYVWWDQKQQPTLST